MQENKVTDIAPEDLERLGLLIEQGQFELLLPKVWEAADVRLIYLMNDAVESFLVFQNARMCGTYQEKFDGELSAALATEEDGYVLAVHQGMNAFTLFFTGMVLEAHLFDYGHTGHFWVKGYEYLRQLEYRLAILHDKLEYLGEEFCSKEERQLASLAEFLLLSGSSKEISNRHRAGMESIRGGITGDVRACKGGRRCITSAGIGKVSQEARAIPCKAAWETDASHAACSSRGFADRAAYGGRRNL